VRARDPRRKVLIDARLRQDCGWTDARILNISRRGLMVRATRAPARGTYVEICRGAHRIVARVVWVDKDRFGARTQDAIPVDAVVNGEAPPLPQPANDRRFGTRPIPPGESHDRSRRASRRLEFVAVTLCASAAALLAFDAVRETLSKPLNLIEAKLGAER